MADTTSPLPIPGVATQVEQDFGFGKVLSEQHGYRLLNRDGSYNVRLENGSVSTRFLSYYTFLNISWPRFFLVFGTLYLFANFIFAGLYDIAGVGELIGDEQLGHFLQSFFFSVHTFATVGFGSIAPVGLLANIIVTAETMVSLLMFAMMTGLVFARFSRPVAGIKYSSNAVIAPYNGITAFEFRVVNAKCNPLFNLEAMVAVSRFEQNGSGRERKYHSLKLERKKVEFFPLNWTIVHAIDESSPLRGWTKQMLIDAEAEFFVLITAVDDTFSQTVNSRASYTAHEIEFGQKFVMMYHQADHHMVLDLAKLDQTDPASLPA